MKYALLIYENETPGEAGGEHAFEEIIAAHNAYAGQLAEKGVLLGGSGLKTSDTATTVRKAGGAFTLHDGPYAEAREQLGGFYLVEAESLDQAIAVAKGIPLFGDGSVEVRPIIDED